MGLYLKKYVEEDCLLGMWLIEEDFDTLYNKIQLTTEENDMLMSYQSMQRRIEWLSVRVLLNEMLKNNSRIIYNESRKPFLSDNSYNISISHSLNFTSILLSKTKKVGIDLEFMSHQIVNVAHKFINDKEYIDELDKRRHLYIHWCAKEALYKICDKQDINFKQNLTLEPFNIEECGVTKGIVENKFGREVFDVNYFSIDGYIIAWCTK
ncbi:MAG TPA: 4'-phosphopantetheinyl transferase superfamily protein [Bacteroidales bacterium]|nr:4'-phosphopantetheinyl transferase superfamily protein [Bacteroidales bacterium]